MSFCHRPGRAIIVRAGNKSSATFQRREVAPYWSRFATHVFRVLVVAQSKKCRVAKTTIRGPLDKPDLSHELRFHPLHVGHFLRRNPCAPMRRSGIGQVDEGTRGDVKEFQRVEHVTPEAWRKASPDLTREP